MIKSYPDLTIDEWNKENRKKLNAPGIYVIHFKKICLYVGASKNLNYRIGQILRGYSFVMNPLLRIFLKYYSKEYPSTTIKVEIFFCKPNELKKLEQVYIEKLKPKLNIYTDKRSLYQF